MNKRNKIALICILVIIVTGLICGYIFFNDSSYEMSKYDGDWVIEDVYAHFFPDDRELLTSTSNGDQYVGDTIRIDSKNKKIIFNNEDELILHVEREYTSEELAQILFSPQWGGKANEMATDISGDKTKIMYFEFKSEEEFTKYNNISLIFTSEDTILLNICEGAGVYYLRRI